MIQFKINLLDVAYNVYVESWQGDKLRVDVTVYTKRCGWFFLSNFFGFYRDIAVALGLFFIDHQSDYVNFLCHDSLLVFADTEPKPFIADICIFSFSILNHIVKLAL